MSLTVLNPDLDPEQLPARRTTVSKSPLHSASVNISDVSEVALNPQPEPQGAGTDGGKPLKEPMNQDYLSPMKLVQLTQEPDLSRVTYLELSINTAKNSLGNFGAYLPNLAQLRFTNSCVACVRDLGTRLSSIKILWMPRCKLKDLDGLPALQNLQELYLSFNDVEDISVITMMSCLDVLDLESNNIKEEDQLGYLALCPSLTSLTLDGNPLSVMLSETTGSVSGYRAAIQEALPSIKLLDDVPLGQEATVDDGGGEKGLQSGSPLSEACAEKDWHILRQSIKKGFQAEQDNSISISPAKTPTPRPMTAPACATSSLSVLPAPPPVAELADESSELTHGLNQVICGNPVRALRARRQHGLSSQSAVTTPYHSADQRGNLISDLTLASISEDVIVTRVKSEESLFPEASPSAPQPAHLPPPPGPPTKRLPTPPNTGPPSAMDSQPRPKSVADFRHRRYRKLSTENPRSFSKPPSAQ